MALRGRKPVETIPRLKALLYGEPGSGKTMAAAQMPAPYIIDTEDGCAHYGDIIEERGGAVFATTSIDDVIQEVRALAREQHEYKTLVIDPFTTLYEVLLDEGEEEVGNKFGKHYGYAAKPSKRLYSLLAQLDMNVIVTAHAKNEYGGEMQIVGKKADAWKKLPYLFDLAFYIERRPEGQRIATVTKTRLKEFPDGEKFEWSYRALAERYGADKLERKATRDLASVEQVREFRGLLAELTETEVSQLKIDKALAKVGSIEDLTETAIVKGIQLIKKHIEGKAA